MRDIRIKQIANLTQNAKRNNPNRNRVYDTSGLAPCCSDYSGGGNLTPLIIENMETNEKQRLELPAELRGKKFRIRKLTPRECFRLMGVDDKDIDTIQAAGISNSGQYKLAGNSIVVDVLVAIFDKMLVHTGNDNQQLELF